jgi:hypothetical protein
MCLSYMKINNQLLKKWTRNKTYRQSKIALTHDERTKYYLHCPTQFRYIEILIKTKDVLENK